MGCAWGGRGVARLGCMGLVMLVGAAGCPGGDDGETMAGSSGGDVTTSTSEGGSTSTGEPGSSSSGPGGSSSEGTTSAVDDTSTSSDGGEETAIPEVFFPEVLAIFQAECFCHRSPMPAAALDLNDDAAYDSIVSVPSAQAAGVDRVSPGDADGSYLYLKLLGEQLSVGGAGTRMPQGGVLPDDQLDLIRHWILGGAQP